MDLFAKHMRQQREVGPDQILKDENLSFADVDSQSSDSELGDLLETESESDSN